MAPPSGDDEGLTGAEPDGRGMLSALVAFVHDARDDGPVAVRYIQCDSCAGPSPHHTEIQIFSATSRDPAFVASPPEVVCAICQSVHPRVVGDEPPRDTEVTCAARRTPLDRLSLDRPSLDRLRLGPFSPARLPLSRLPLNRLPLARFSLGRPPLDRMTLDRLRDRLRHALARVGGLPATRAIRWPGTCAHTFQVPASAPAALCPRCATIQPGPGFPQAHGLSTD